MWFGVAPVTPPHVRRRDERLQQDLQVSPASASASVGLAAASPRPRAAALRVAGRSDDYQDAKSPRRGPRAVGASPRLSGRAPLAALAKTQAQRNGGLEEEEEAEAPERQEMELQRRRNAQSGDSEEPTQTDSRSENQRHRDGDAANWSEKDPEERRPDGVPLSISTRTSSPRMPRPPSPSLRFNLASILKPVTPRSRRASRRASRSNEACAAATVDRQAPSELGSLLPLLYRASEQRQPSKGATTTAPKLIVAARPETLVGHVSSVCALNTIDDNVLVSGSGDGLVKIWSRISFTCVQTLSGHEDNVSCIDAHGDWLVSGSHDTTLRVYRRKRRRSTYGDNCQSDESTEYELHGVCRGHTGHVTKVQIPETIATHVVSCSDDATLRVWNAELSQCVLILSGHTSRVTCFAICQLSWCKIESRWLYTICSGAADASVCLWRVHQPVLENQLEAGRRRDFGLDLDLEVVESCIWHVHKSTVQCVAVVGGVGSSVSSTGGDHVGAPLLVSGSNDGTIQLFNLQTLEHLGKLHNCKSPVYALAATPSGRLICSTRDGRLLLFASEDWFSIAPGLAPVELNVAPTWLSSLQLRGDLVACCGEDVLYVVSTVGSALAVLLAVETNHSFINCVRWVHSRALLTCGQDTTIRLWKIV